MRKKYRVKLVTVSECGVWDHEEVREIHGESPEKALEAVYWEVDCGLWGAAPGCRILVSLL